MIFYNFLSLLIFFCSTSGEANWNLGLLNTENDLNSEQNPNEISKCECNIPVLTEPITQQEFIEKYAYESPVVFRRSDKSRNKEFQEMCKFENLIQVYGDKYVTVSTANTYSYKTFSMQLAEYLNVYVLASSENGKQKYGNETMYFFGGNNVTEWKGLFDIYERPFYNLPLHKHAYSFGVAASHTGVPFHIHGPGFAESIHGRKRWFLYKPDDKPHFNPDKSTLQWFLEEYRYLKPSRMPYECILNPLDVIYFPDKWWHATLNVDNAVFISTFLSNTL